MVKYKILLAFLSLIQLGFLLTLAWTNSIEMNYQGDQGIRVFDSVFDARQDIDVVEDHIKSKFFDIHPIGDYITRVFAWKTYAFLVAEASNPIAFNLSVSIVASGITVFMFSLLALRISGVFASLLTFSLLSYSFVVTDARASVMGEALFYPFLSLGIYFLYNSISSEVSKRGNYAHLLAGIAFLVASFYRPEALFLLPGLCLALWWAIGLKKAIEFGFIGSIYTIASMAYPILSKDAGLTLLNAHQYYFSSAIDIASLIQTPFIQQLLHDPFESFCVVGIMMAASYLWLINKEEIVLRKIVVILLSAVLGYVLIMSAAVVLGFSTHKAYRLATPAIHLLIPAVAISTAELVKFTFKVGLNSNNTSKKGFSIPLGLTFIVVLFYATQSIYHKQSSILKERGLAGTTEIINVALARMKNDDSVFIEKMRFWENSLIAYFSDRDGYVCTYARCEVADDYAIDLWNKVREGAPQAGTLSWGEFAALRSHAFLHNERPSFVLAPNTQLYTDWKKTAKQIWREDWRVWHSHLFEYAHSSFDVNKIKTDMFVRLGKINGQEYFESYVFLIPRYSNQKLVLYQAYYGRTPE